MSAFRDMELQDGVRLSWNVWPHSRLGAAKCVVPFTATYAPNTPLETMPVREDPSDQPRVFVQGGAL